MDFNELLELKKEIDELSLYYSALKEKSKELDELFYSNNLLDLDYDEDEEDKEKSIDDEINEGRSHYSINKIIGYWIRYAIIIIGGSILDTPSIVNTCLIIVNLVYYSVVLLGYEKIMRKKLEDKEEDKIDFEEIAKEKRDVDRRLEYVREKYVSASAEYEKLVGKLNEKEYEEYLEYISEYLQFMLENSKDLLNEAQENCKVPDYDMEMNMLLDEKEEEHPYRLN